MKLNVTLVKIAAFVLGGLSVWTSAASSQPQTVRLCTYSRCALGIAPTWNGLAVVQGVDEQRVANLSFFWPRDIRRALSTAAGAGPDSATTNVRRAVRLRRVAAVFTDAGLVLGGYAVARAITNKRLNSSDRAFGITGAVAFAVSVPLQFAADGALSRAVWWYNSRFSP
jgi:hypothetical protein